MKGIRSSVLKDVKKQQKPFVQSSAWKRLLHSLVPVLRLLTQSQDRDPQGAPVLVTEVELAWVWEAIRLTGTYKCPASLAVNWELRITQFAPQTPFPPSLPSLIGGFGKYRVGKYLHWLSQCDGAWWVVAARRVAVEACVLCSWPVALGLLLAPESLPTLAGTISKLIHWRWVLNSNALATTQLLFTSPLLGKN